MPTFDTVQSETVERRIAYSKAAKAAGTTMHVLDQVTGGLVPMSFHPEDERPLTTKRTVGEETIHLFQSVVEESSNPLADDAITWIITSLDDGITLKSGPPGWLDETTIDAETFDEGSYTPLTAVDGTPVWGY